MAVKMSCSPSAVSIMPSKKSAAGMLRSPPSAVTAIVASSARNTVGRSEAGSACATLPPMVPRLRTAGSPISPAASASAGHRSASSDEAASSAWVVSAPIRTRPSATLMPFSSSSRPMSMSAAGVASRSFRSGIRL